MSKVKQIKIENLKAIGNYEANFNGCTAIVVAGNNKGKTTLLRSIPDRARFVRPDFIIKEGSTKGKGEMTLDTGERLVWEFDSKGTDKLTYYSTDNIKQNVTKDLGARFFPPMFDIDKFLQSAPKEQAKQLQKIIGIDFTEIDARYQKAYNERTTRNAEAERYHVKLTAMLKVDEVKPVDLTALQEQKETIRQKLNSEYLANKAKNDEARKEWNAACDEIRKKVEKFNSEQADLRVKYNACGDALSILAKHGYGGSEVANWLEDMKSDLKEQKTAQYPVEPTYIQEMPDDKPMKDIDAAIFTASETNAKAQAYQQYIDHKTATEAAAIEATKADEAVKSIEAERQKMIESANFPKGISITSDGITVDGLPLDRNQISTSKLYTTALRIASMNLGEVKTLYFDASFLDRNSLAEIETWANENDLQLLIERPDFEGGEIRYEIIENAPINIEVKKNLFDNAA